MRTTNAPTEAERVWHLAASSLLQRDMPDLLDAHLSHAQARFPAEARFRLAQIVADEFGLWPDSRINALNKGQESEFLRAQARRLSLERFITRYETLARLPTVRDEALLRAAHIEVRLGRLHAARDRLRQVGSPDDDSLAYLRAFFTGQVFDRLDLPEAAAEAYATALRERPGAHSASMALASLLSRMDRSDVAADIVDEMFEAPLRLDPWRVYGLGDYRLYGSYLTQLRASIR